MRVREQVVHVVRHVFVIVILLSCHIFIYYTHTHTQSNYVLPAMFCLLRTIPSDLNMLTSSFSGLIAWLTLRMQQCQRLV